MGGCDWKSKYCNTCLVWSILCGVFNVFAQSCPVCFHQLDLFFPSHPTLEHRLVSGKTRLGRSFNLIEPITSNQASMCKDLGINYIVLAQLFSIEIKCLRKLSVPMSDGRVSVHLNVGNKNISLPNFPLPLNC